MEVLVASVASEEPQVIPPAGTDEAQVTPAAEEAVTPAASDEAQVVAPSDGLNNEESQAVESESPVIAPLPPSPSRARRPSLLSTFSLPFEPVAEGDEEEQLGSEWSKRGVFGLLCSLNYFLAHFDDF